MVIMNDGIGELHLDDKLFLDDCQDEYTCSDEKHNMHSLPDEKVFLLIRKET